MKDTPSNRLKNTPRNRLKNTPGNRLLQHERQGNDVMREKKILVGGRRLEVVYQKSDDSR